MDTLRSATKYNIGFLVRALDYGGSVFEDDRPRTLAEGMAALEKRLVRAGGTICWDSR
jgi:hypothetical protein